MVYSSTGQNQILAFRLNSHHLANRLPPGSLLRAAGACGIQNTPPGAAALALTARVSSLSADEFEQALTIDKTLLQAWSLRGAPYVFPTTDTPVFTLGLLPSDEDSIRDFIPGVVPALEKTGTQATKVVDLMGEAILELLDGRTLTKDELGIELARCCLPYLSATQKEAWQSPSWYAPGQTLGESIARFALPVLSLKGLCCHADRQGGKAYLARTDQWLGSSHVFMDPDLARAELVRRYLHCFGPSTFHHFAEWAGISLDQAAQSWKLVEAEFVEVHDHGKRTQLLRQDLEGFQNPPSIEEVRFLPPHDLYLSFRDRERLVPDKSIQRLVWKHAGNPGVLLVNGDVAGLWRQRKKENRLNITIEQFASLSQEKRSQIETEAITLASMVGCTKVQVEFRWKDGDLR